MIVTYRPDGPDGRVRRWDLKDVRLLMSEAQAIERVTDRDWSELRTQQTLIVRDSPSAKRALVWVLMKREVPDLRHRAFDPAEDSITVRLDAEEAAAMREEIDRAYGDDEEAAAQALKQLESITDPECLADTDAAVEDTADDALPEAAPKAAAAAAGEAEGSPSAA
jgi:hypothetical protein